MRVALALALLEGAAATEPARPLAAIFGDPTDRYPHNILGASPP